jgi:low temperature requirement protein LtrA
MASWFTATARGGSDRGRVSTFELFFDLVFVFAFTQITHFMVVTHSDIGVLQAITMLGFLWWSWSSYGWLANQSNVDHGILRAGMIVAMCAVFVLALAIPTAFVRIPGALNAALVIAIAYFIIRIVHFGLYFVAAGDDKGLRRQVWRSSITMWTSLVLMVVGAIIGGIPQTGIWLAAFVVDMLVTYLTSRDGDWRIHSASHWTERHGLVIMLALGESVVAIGEGAARSPLSLAILGGAVMALLLTTFLGWLYFDAISIAAERILAATPGRERATLATEGYTLAHLLLIAGIVISALGVEEVMGVANSATAFGLFGSCALFGGTSLYLFAHALFWKRVGGAWKVLRLAGATVLLVLIPVGTVVPALAALGMVVAVAAVVVVVESILYAQQRREIRASADA